MAEYDVRTDLTSNDIRSALMSIRGKGIQEYEPKVNRRLGAISQNSEEQNVNQVKIGIVKWLKQKFPSYTKDQILDLIEQKGGFVALTPAFLVTEIQREIKEEKDKKEKEAQAVVQRREDEEIANDQRQDQEQNQDLFILTTNGNGERIIEIKEVQRDLQDRQRERQRQIAEKALRVLEAMEKARDAVERGEPIPEMDLSYLKDLTPQEFAKQMAVFKSFGLQPVTLGRDRQVREDPEREVTLETITKEDVEQGDVAFAIQFDKLKDPNWRKMAEKSKAFFEQKGLKTKYIPETTIEDDVISAIAGSEKAGRTNQVIKDDGEVR